MSSTREMIALAMLKNELLTVKEFIKTVKFPINKLYFNELWKIIDQSSVQNSEENWIYISDGLIDMIGFMGERTKKNTNCYRLLLDNFTIPKDYKEITKEHPLFAPLCGGAESNYKHNRKFYVATSKCLKKLMLKANTKTSDKVYDYYIQLEELMHVYLEYLVFFFKY
jgi:hypothetical protein